MKHPLIVFVLLLNTLLFSQCDRPEEPVRPAQLLPRDKMVRVLVDLHLTEARVENAGTSPDSARALFNRESKALYQRHNTSETLFRQSMQYYAIHGKDLEEIYGVVIDSINAREVKLPRQ
ncbi:DUF4296 domain-containing protein [Solirubrum puertoriconensis]|uniref:DUF4296 domain-containing protein n=1 Tax=Solirubrum puertoriconensis TaxID=1751427 RepID=A0A9X0HM24_SOLP1|nr:DUF4296 domain-containing protein [Solirubrum puertoriconensis]KUG08408.1 hypothetical protein ASU33_09585 [Solirubrum puertoriconensis]